MSESKPLKCAGCLRELEIGDRYIEDTSSGFLKSEGEAVGSEIDSLVAGIFGGSGNKILFCEDCTEPGGDYLFETVYGDEDDGRSGRLS